MNGNNAACRKGIPLSNIFTVKIPLDFLQSQAPLYKFWLHEKPYLQLTNRNFTFQRQQTGGFKMIIHTTTTTSITAETEVQWHK